VVGVPCTGPMAPEIPGAATSFALGFASCAPNMQRWCRGGQRYVPSPGAIPVMAGVGLGERPAVFKIKYGVSRIDVERDRTLTHHTLVHHTHHTPTHLLS
jgi:hypothetical protein